MYVVPWHLGCYAFTQSHIYVRHEYWKSCHAMKLHSISAATMEVPLSRRCLSQGGRTGPGADGRYGPAQNSTYSVPLPPCLYKCPWRLCFLNFFAIDGMWSDMQVVHARLVTHNLTGVYWLGNLSPERPPFVTFTKIRSPNQKLLHGKTLKKPSVGPGCCWPERNA